jgi:hypothetical protein
METCDKTEEHLEMVAVKEGNWTHVADDIDWCVSQIDSLFQWHVVNYYPVILNCTYYIVTSQIGHQVEPYLLSVVEILSSTCFCEQR